MIKYFIVIYEKMVSRRKFLKFVGMSALVATGITTYSYFIEPNNITITTIKLKDLYLNVRIVHISDTHFATSVFNPDKVIDLIYKISPNYIFHTGDVITYLDGLNDAVKFTNELSEICKIYVVAGNHDHWSGLGSEGLKRKLETNKNINVLNNSSVREGDFWIIGVDDPYTYMDNINTALDCVYGKYPRILLAHSPQIIDKVVGKVDLIFSGHTHAGQVRLPLIGPLYLPLPHKYWKYDYGLFKVNKSYMFVTRGIGTSFFPIRFNCPPEIVIFDL